MTYPVKCPVCNQRVFDIVDGMQGCIEYKCPRCKKVSRYAKHMEPADYPEFLRLRRTMMAKKIREYYYSL